MSVKTYNPKKVIVIFGGVPLTGFVDGSFVQVTATSDGFTKRVGADGEIARAQSSDESSEVTITLMHTSLSNAYLSTLKDLDRKGGEGVKPLAITDMSGHAFYFWKEAWIRKAPDTEFSQEITDRAWVFDTGQPSQELI